MTKIILIFLTFLAVLEGIHTTRKLNTSIVDSERSLLKTILNDYDKNLRPSDTVEVKFSLYLNQIITLIEQEQIVVLNVFLDHEWRDERLTWNPIDYNNITLLRIPSDLLWT